MRRTFSIIKPDATKRNITGSINKIIEDNNLVIISKELNFLKRKLRGFMLFIRKNLSLETLLNI